MIDWLILNWTWVVFFIVFGFGLVWMRKIPKVQAIGNVLFKINSQKGISLMDRLGRKHSKFWINVGDLALMLLFGGLGTAYVTNHREKKGRAVILAVLAFFAAFIYIGPNVIQLFPFVVILSSNTVAISIGLIAAILTYKITQRLSVRVATFASFILAIVVMASPYFLMFIYSGDVLTLGLGIAIGVLGLPAIVMANLLIQAANIYTGISSEPGINIGIPDMENGVPVLKYLGTGLSIPIFPDILIALILLLVFHEGFHGLVARAQNIPIKNTGLLFLSIIPVGAFVEPDEKKFRKEKAIKRLRVYAVGSFANIFVVAVICFLAGNLMFSNGMVKGEGFIVDSVIVGSSADGAFKSGDVITEINGEEMQDFQDFYELMEGKRPGEELVIETKNRTVNLVIGQSPYTTEEQGFVGLARHTDPIVMIFVPELSHSQLEPSLETTIFNLIKWTFFLNLMIGILNLLPVKPFDGGFIYDGFFDWIEKGLPHGKRLRFAKVFSQGFVLLILLIFLINLSPYFIYWFNYFYSLLF